jgi:hypothetical protein
VAIDFRLDLWQVFLSLQPNLPHPLMTKEPQQTGTSMGKNKKGNVKGR